MDKKTKAGPKSAEIVGKIVALLQPLTPEERQKVISASLTLLGESATSWVPAPAAPGLADQSAGGAGKPDPNLGNLPAKAKTWASQNAITLTQLEQVFDIDGNNVSIIAQQAPGKSDKEKTHNAYVLQGVGRLLVTGDASFDDKDARKVCVQLGCYNNANHSTYMTAKGNVLTGSKKTGWKLTAPGLKHGADLIKQLAE